MKNDLNLKVKKLVLAVGAEPKFLHYPKVTLPLSIALNPELLKTEVSKDDVVAVFGDSHSAVLIL